METIEVAPATGPRRRASASLLGGTSQLVRRRLWRDRVLLGASTAIVAMATALAYAGPEVVLRTIDDGASDAVEAAGDGANITVEFAVGNTTGDNVQSVQGVEAVSFADLAADIPRFLPGVIASLVEGYEGSVASRNQAISFELPPISDDAAADDPDTFNATENRDLLSPRLETYASFVVVEDVEWIVSEGRLPREPAGDRSEDAVLGEIDGETVTRIEATSEVLEVALTGAVAELYEFEVGTVFLIDTITGSRATAHVVGIVEPRDLDLTAWQHHPEVLEPVRIDTPGFPVVSRGSIVVSPAQAELVSNALEQPFRGEVELLVGSEGLTLQTARDVADAMRDLIATPSSLLPTEDVNVSVTSELGPALEAYPARARAALAQMSVMVAGVIGVAAVVIALMARLLLSRRASDIALERARGASVPSIGLRLLIESAIFTAVGVAAGYALATALVGEVSPASAAVALVAAVAIGASPLLGVQMSRRSWTGRRTPANRADRAKIAKAKRARRLTLESLTVVIAVLAVVTLRGRGVLQTQTSGIDPFLAAAPLLLAVGITVIVLRIFPWPLKVIQGFARKTRGAAGVIALAKARQAIPVLPLLALTLAISIAVAGGMLVATVRSGQDQAAWERVGGEVRIDAELAGPTVDEIEAAGVPVAEVYLRPATQLQVGNSYELHTFLAVDDNYADVLDAAGIYDTAEYRALADAAAAWRPGEPIPALGTAQLRAVDFAEGRAAYVGRVYVDIEFIGDATVVPNGWSEGPYVIVPLDLLLQQEFDREVFPNLYFLTGDDAEAAALAAGVSAESMSTREGWLTGVRDSALIGGVERMMTLAVIAVALLAAVALLVTVLHGVKERGLELSMLRTQGLSNRFGWWIALSELAPLSAAAVIGGAGAGLIILLVLGGTLGLEILAGGIAPPPLVADPVFLTAVAAGVLVLLFMSVSAEVASHRRNKLSEVLRLGEVR